jgi:hypothetical protein
MVAFAKANPGKVSYAHAGIGGATHVGMEEFALAAGITLNAIAYKGGATALADTLAGQVDMLADSSSWAPHVESRSIATAGHLGRAAHAALRRYADAQGVGLQGRGRRANGIGAPAGLPIEVEKRLRDALRIAVNSDEFKTVAARIDAPLMSLSTGRSTKDYVSQVYQHETQLIERLKLKEMLAARMTMKQDPLIRLHADDNVLVAKRAIALGETFGQLGVRARGQIPPGHKIAARAITQGEAVRKYNAVIGVAARDIEAGDYVHTHNLALVDSHRDPGFGQDVRLGMIPEGQRASFEGYVREDGRVGARNFIGILSTVNCSATVINRIAAHFTPERLKDFPNVDGGRVRADHRLRHVFAQPALRPAAANAGRLCAPSQHGRRADRGPGLRTQSGR